MNSNFNQTPESTCLTHWVIIELSDKLGRPVLQRYSWKGLRFDLRLKYDWYFKYRAALLQVKYPKKYIEVRWGSEPAVGKTLKQMLKCQLSSKQGQVTKFQNRLNNVIKHWDQLFPIEDDPIYIKCLNKLNRLKLEYENIKASYKNLP